MVGLTASLKGESPTGIVATTVGVNVANACDENIGEKAIPYSTVAIIMTAVKGRRYMDMFSFILQVSFCFGP